MYAGLKSRKSGYESLLEATSMMSKKFNPNIQQELVIQTLDSAIPKIILKMASLLQYWLLLHFFRLASNQRGRENGIPGDYCVELIRVLIPNNDGIVKRIS